MSQHYIQYGCGTCAPEGWLNFDSSPTLKIQQNKFLKTILKSRLNVLFPPGVKYGDIVKGLPVKNNSATAVYCSHVLEHLSLCDFRTALKNTYDLLADGGIFRCVVPDLESYAKMYLDKLSKGDSSASLEFVGKKTMLGLENRPKRIKEFIVAMLGNSHHLWMWDKVSLSKELINVGFKDIRVCEYGDASDKMFNLIEDPDRFIDAVAIECFK